MKKALLMSIPKDVWLKKFGQGLCLAILVFLTASCQSLSSLSKEARLIKGDGSKEYFLVGSYTTNPEHGIYLLSYDQQTQQLQQEKVVAKTFNPSYLSWQKKHKTLYNIATTADKSPLLEVYQWQTSLQEFELLHSQEVLGKGICHINVNHDQSQLAIVNYTSGEGSLYSLNQSTHIPELKGQFKNTGRSITPRQKSPHIHYAGWGTHNRFLYLTDLGTDEILVFDSLNKEFRPKHRIKLDAGDGPRHLAFHPTKNLIYSLNELSNTITIFTQNIQTGVLTSINKVQLLSAHEHVKHASASAIRISESGNHLYIAMRGENMIYGFNIQTNGQLTLINKVSTGGDHPRDFNFSEKQNYLLVANQHSNQMNLIERDIKTGWLTTSQVSIAIESPSFIQTF